MYMAAAFGNGIWLPLEIKLPKYILTRGVFKEIVSR